MCFGGGSKPPSPPKPPPLPPPVTEPKAPPKPTPPPEPVQQVGNEVAPVQYGGQKKKRTNLTVGSSQTPSATVSTGASSNATGINV